MRKKTKKSRGKIKDLEAKGAKKVKGGMRKAGGDPNSAAVPVPAP